MDADVEMLEAGVDPAPLNPPSSALGVPSAHEDLSKEAETRSYSVDEMHVDLASDLVDVQGNPLPREAAPVFTAVRLSSSWIDFIYSFVCNW